MNALTQQQINQYQWQAADGVAVPVNPIPYNVLDENWVNKASELLPMLYHTNAPDGIYSGEAFELEYQGLYESGWFKISELVYQNYITNPIGLLVDDTRLFLRFKPSHLPAVLTTQPGEEWKDRYYLLWNDGEYHLLPTLEQGEWTTIDLDKLPSEPLICQWLHSELGVVQGNVVIYSGEKSNHYQKTIWVFPDDEGRSADIHISEFTHWRRVPKDAITPPAEQEAETVEQAADKEVYHLKPDTYLGQKFREYFKHGASWQLEQLQSTLTQKDQRIAELEREAEQLKEKLSEINNLCGTVNFSSHNQMREAIEGAVELSELHNAPKH